MRNHRGFWGALTALGCGAALAGPGVWTTQGPDGGSVPLLQGDALLADGLVAASRGGVFRTTDGGLTWQRFEAGLNFDYPFALESASAASRIFLAPDGQHLYRSDAGADWMPTALALASDDYVMDVSLRPGTGQHLAVASAQGLQLSADAGASFSPAGGTGLPAAPPPLHQVDYVSATRLYLSYLELPAGAMSPLYRSDDGGSSWTPLGVLPGGLHYAVQDSGGLETAPSDIDRVYYSTPVGVYVSDDAGATWAACGGAAHGGGRIVIEAGDPDRLWISGNRGLYSSSDGCVSWTPHAAGLSADGSRTDITRSLVLAPGFPADDRLWVGTAYGGVYRSADAGASFVPSSAGLIATNIRALAPHPVDSQHLLAGYGDAFSPAPAIFRSLDGGATWAASTAGLRATQVRGLAIDPTTAAAVASTHVYAVGSSRVDDEAPSPLNLDAGVYKSVNGGASWTTIDAGMPVTLGGARFIGTARSVVLDPRSCASPPPLGPCGSGPLQTLYLTASGRADFTTGNYVAARVYKSLDAGASWNASETGLPAASAGAGACGYSQIAVPLVIDPSDSNTLYVGLVLSYDGSGACPVPSIPNGIFKSVDAGATWTHASSGLPTLDGPGSAQWNALALAIDPTTPSTLYAGIYRSTPTASFDGRVYKSTDAGASWNEISTGIAGLDVRALLVDPADPDVVYAGLGGSPVNPSGIYRSDDGGLTWNSFSIGLPSDAATALAFDPHDPDRLLAGTPGGVWEYTRVPDPDADGAATLVEDAAPNGGDGDGSGTPDAQESGVASFPAAPSASLRGAAAGSITVAVEPLLGACTRLNNAHALVATTLPADVARGHGVTDYAHGVLRFELPDCRRARVTVRFHGADHADRDWSWRNYGPTVPGDSGTFAWYDFPAARKLTDGGWELTLDATQQGNYRPDENSLLFVGAPGFLDLRVFGDGFEPM